MLRIRRKQMDTLDALARASFVRRAVEAVAGWQAPRFTGWSRDDLTRWVDTRVARAADLALDDEPVVLAWLAVSADLGDVAADDPSVATLLRVEGALDDWTSTRALIDAIASPGADPVAASGDAPADEPGDAPWP